MTLRLPLLFVLAASFGATLSSCGTRLVGFPKEGMECEVDAECAAGQLVCVDGKCTKPCPDVACSAGQVCNAASGKCEWECGQACDGGVCDVAARKCVGCLNDSSCSGGKTCDAATKQCVCGAGQKDCRGTCIASSACCAAADCAVPGQECVAGRCECAAGQKLCNGACIASTACCGDVDCTGGQICQSNKACGCPSGQKVCNGQCIPNAQCCNSADCDGGQTCQSGTCGCPSGTKLCNNQCIPDAQCCTMADCTGGQQCTAGACGCPTGQKLCNGQCIPNANCCTSAECTGGQACSAGTCSCPSGQKLCNGQCIPNANCCTSAECTGGQACSAGTCSCPSGQKLCNGQCIPNAQCCTSAECTAVTGQTCQTGTCACPAGQKTCGNRCIPNAACCTSADCTGGGQVCVADACVCPTGQTFCAAQNRCIPNGQCCVNTDCTGERVCGASGCTCPNGQTTWRRPLPSVESIGKVLYEPNPGTVYVPGSQPTAAAGWVGAVRSCSGSIAAETQQSVPGRYSGSFGSLARSGTNLVAFGQYSRYGDDGDAMTAQLAMSNLAATATTYGTAGTYGDTDEVWDGTVTANGLRWGFGAVSATSGSPYRWMVVSNPQGQQCNYWGFVQGSGRTLTSEGNLVYAVTMDPYQQVRIDRFDAAQCSLTTCACPGLTSSVAPLTTFWIGNESTDPRHIIVVGPSLYVVGFAKDQSQFPSLDYFAFVARINKATGSVEAVYRHNPTYLWDGFVGASTDGTRLFLTGGQGWDAASYLSATGMLLALPLNFTATSTPLFTTLSSTTHVMWYSAYEPGPAGGLYISGVDTNGSSSVVIKCTAGGACP